MKFQTAGAATNPCSPPPSTSARASASSMRYGFDMGGGRSQRGEREELRRRRVRPGDHRLHRAVAAIAHPAGKMQPSRLARDEDAIADILNAPFDDDAGDARLDGHSVRR